MFDFFSLMVAIVALIVARKTFNEIAALKARLYTLERSSAPASAAATPPPLAPRQAPDQTFSSSPPKVPAEPAIVAVRSRRGSDLRGGQGCGGRRGGGLASEGSAP